MEKQIVSGVTLAKDEAKITLRDVKDKPGVAAAVFGALADESIVVDMIVQNVSDDGATTDITFTVPDSEYDKSVTRHRRRRGGRIEYRQDHRQSRAGQRCRSSASACASHAGVASSMFKALADKGINIQLITTSEIKTSVLIEERICRACGAGPPYVLRAGQQGRLTADSAAAARRCGRRGAAWSGELWPTAISGPRVLLRQLRETMAEPLASQDRLDKIVNLIADNMRADVCSFYVLRDDGALELFATRGLKREAVHMTTLRLGEGLVGLIAAEAEPLSLEDAPAHPAFAYRPETGEDPFSAFLGVPVLRAGQTLGVLVVQNKDHRVYGEDETEAMLTTATILAEMIATSDFDALIKPGSGHRPPPAAHLPGRELHRRHRARQGRAARSARRRHQLHRRGHRAGEGAARRGARDACASRSTTC